MRTVLACLILLAAPPCAAWAQPAPFDFHGLRLGMSPAQMVAAGYLPLRQETVLINAEAYTLATAKLPQVESLIAYFFEERLYQVKVSYRPRKKAAVRALARDVLRQYGAPPDLDDGTRMTVRWKRDRLTFHFGAVRRDGEGWASSLMVTDEAAYDRLLSRAPEPFCEIKGLDCPYR